MEKLYVMTLLLVLTTCKLNNGLITCHANILLGIVLYGTYLARQEHTSQAMHKCINLSSSNFVVYTPQVATTGYVK